jgi:hypothetical protein
MWISLSLATLIRTSAIGLASGFMLLACSPPYLAQGGLGEERAIAKAVFAHKVAEQRRAEASAVGPADIELDTRRLQWEEGSESLGRPGTERLLRSWLRFQGHHPRAVIEEILQHSGAARVCESATADEVCHSKTDGAVVVAMSAPRFASPDSAHVRVVLFSELQDKRFMELLALYLVTVRRSAQGWEVVSEELLFQT